MAKFKSTFEAGQPIVMQGRVKFADDESGQVTVTLNGYEIPITTHIRNVESGGPAPKGKFTGRDQAD